MNLFYLGNFFRNAVFSYGYRFASVLFGLLYFFIVANSLGPEQYGVLAFMLDFLGTATLLLGFNALYEVLNIFVPKQRSKQVVNFLLLIGSIGAALFSLAILFFPEVVLYFTNQGTIELVKAISAVIFFSTISALFVNLFTGTKNFGKILKMGVIENIVNLFFVSLFLFFLNGGIMEVVYAKTISIFVSTIIGLYYFKKISLLDSKADWKPIRKFAFFSILAGIVKRTSTQMLLIFIGLFIDPIKMGFYYALQKMGTYFIDLPLNSLNVVLLPTISEHENDIEKLQKLVSYSIKFYVVSSIIFSLALLIFSPILLLEFFPKYSQSISLVPLFAAFFVLTFDMPLGTFYRAINRNYIILYSNLLQLFITMFFGFFFVKNFGVEGVLILMVLNRIVSLVYQFIYLWFKNYKIEFWPRPKDIIFFFKTIMQTIFKKSI